MNDTTHDRANDLSRLTESFFQELKNYVERYKDVAEPDVLIRTDIRNLLTQIDGLVLSWLIQSEYMKLRAQEVKLAGEIFNMQQEGQKEGPIERTTSEPKDVVKPWSIEDED